MIGKYWGSKIYSPTKGERKACNIHGGLWNSRTSKEEMCELPITPKMVFLLALGALGQGLN
jgi:hypothetical protein